MKWVGMMNNIRHCAEEAVLREREKLERMKVLCKERDTLYERRNDLKGQKWKMEKALE